MEAICTKCGFIKKGVCAIGHEPTIEFLPVSEYETAVDVSCDSFVAAGEQRENEIRRRLNIRKEVEDQLG